MENPQAQVGCGEEESIGLLFRQLVQVSPARKWKKHTSRTLQRDLWSRRASFVDPRVAPHLFCWLNVLQQSRFDVLVIQCGVVVVRGGISPFESSFLNNTKRRGSAGCKTYRHFMWVQCRQENKSVCAQIVDSPNFCHSSQDEMGGGGGGLKITRLTLTENTHTAVATLLSPSACARLLLSSPVFKGEILSGRNSSGEV